MKKRRARLGRIFPLKPRNIPPRYFLHFGKLDPVLAKEVADHVQVHAIEGYERVDIAILNLGRQRYFGRSKGFELLKAGRYLYRANRSRS